MSGISNDSRFSATTPYYASATSQGGGGGGGTSTLTSPVAFAPTTGSSTAVLSNSVATSGTVVIGSSVASPAVLSVSDLAGVGVVAVNGASGQNALVLAGATATNPCLIATSSAGGAGAILDIGSSSANTSAIIVSDTATVINKLGGAPVVLLAIGNIAAAAQGPPIVPTTGTISLAPLSEGLWCVVGTGSGATSTQNTADAQFSTLMYVNSAGVVEMGGSISVNVGTSLNSADQVFELYPLNGATNLGYAYTGGQQLTSFGIYAFKISGPIPGTV
jgi:hypothetical protein